MAYGQKLLVATLASVLFWILRPQTPEPQAHVPLLDRQVLQVGKLGKQLPLTKALAYVGLNIRGSYTLYGIEVLLKEDKEPMVDLDIQENSTVRTTLDGIFRQLPNYRYEVAGQHLINVCPISAKQDATDPLNIQVPAFDVVNQPVDRLLTLPNIYIPELDARLRPTHSASSGRTHPLGPGLGGGEPRITLHLRNSTVREILNAVSAATENVGDRYSPLGWVYYFEPDKSRYNWTLHWSVPSGWRQGEKNSTGGL